MNIIIKKIGHDCSADLKFVCVRLLFVKQSYRFGVFVN
jgi:hypothetical protein